MIPIPLLSLVLAISLKFFQTSKKVVINSFCCFLFLNYGEKVEPSGVMRLMPKATIRFFRNEWKVFLERQLQKYVIFLFKM